MIDRDVFDAFSENPEDFFKHVIALYLTNHSNYAYTADEINKGIGNTDEINTHDHPIIHALNKLVSENIVQEKTLPGMHIRYYMIYP